MVVAYAGPLSLGRGGTGTIADVQHVVILMQENRSFDHYFGALRGVRGFNDPNVLMFTNGMSVFYQQQGQGQGYVLPFPMLTQCMSDVEHDWGDGHQAWDGGKWDQWVLAKGTSAMPYYRRSDLAFYYALADAYTVCDANFCSVLGPTFPNRLYFMTGMIDPRGTGRGPATNNYVPPGGFTWTTYPERLQAAGVSWKVYQQWGEFINLNTLAWFRQYIQARPGNPLYDRGVATVTNVLTSFRADVSNGTLPRVSWIIPPWVSSEHPYLSPANGQVFTRQLLNALASNPAVFNSTVFVLNYDENGGFFDHVPSPTPQPGTTDEFLMGQPIGLGARVPMIVISPWSRGGYVCSQVFDHTSVIRFLERWTGVMEPNISAWRRQVCGDLTSAFDFTAPDYSFPALPNAFPYNCSDGFTPVVPTLQTFPMQEAGSRPSRPLPYGPNVTSLTDCGTETFYLQMTNNGTASVHFSVFANAFLNGGPWQYDVPAGGSVSDDFDVTATSGGLYDLTCYGPNGFQRRFAGSISNDCSQLEVTSSIDPATGGVILALQNYGGTPVTFTVTNAYQGNVPIDYDVPPGQTVTDTFALTTGDAGWYDLTATASADALFLRRFAGYAESMRPSLSLELWGSTLFLTFPAWASGYTVESSPDLSQGSWSAVSVSPILSGDTAWVILPASDPAAFFRLRN
jgi:phospholipase C